MKRFICLLLSMIPFLSVSAQEVNIDSLYVVKNGSVVVEKVIPFEISKSEASAAVKSWLVTKLNDSNETVKNSSDDYYVAKILTPRLAIFSMGQWYSMGDVTIEVRFKEDRMKIAVSCSNIQVHNFQETNRKSYSPLDASPLAEKHNDWKTYITKKAAEETFDNLVVYMAAIVVDLNNAVQNASAEDDW